MSLALSARSPAVAAPLPPRAPRSPLLGLALSALLAAPACAGADWPALVPPPRAVASEVAPQLRVNGLSSRILHFTTELPTAEVLSYYQRLWSKGRPPQAVNAGEWQGLSSLQGEFQLTLQVKPGARGRGSEGMVSAGHLRDLRADFVPADWPQFADTQVLQVTESEDGPKRSVLLNLVSRASYGTNLQRWRGEWQRRGLTLSRETEVAGARPGERGWMALFDGAAESLELTVAEVDNGRSVSIMAHRLLPAARRP